MGRAPLALIALLVGLLGGACGDPIVVLGDAPGIARVVAGIGDSIGSRVDSLATRTRLTEPAAVAFDESGQRLWFADRGSSLTQGGVTRRVGRLFAVRSDGRLSMLVDRGGCAGAVCLESPHSIVVAPGGDVYVTDVVGHRIFRLRAGTPPLEVVAGDGNAGSTPDGVRARDARIAAPSGIAWLNGRLLFAEQANHRVRSLEQDGTLATVAGTGDPGFGGDGGLATESRLAAPAGIDALGDHLYIADRANGRVRQVDLATGIIRSIAGTGAAGFGGDGGPATAARLDRPESVSASADGATLFVTDHGNDRVRAIDLRSGGIATFAGTGDRAFVPGPRQAGDISLLRPAALATAHAGFLFIADPGHSVVWRLTLRF